LEQLSNQVNIDAADVAAVVVAVVGGVGVGEASEPGHCKLADDTFADVVLVVEKAV